MRRSERLRQKALDAERGGKILIYIDPPRDSGLSSFSLSVRPTDTILSIKERIARIVDYYPEYQVLTIWGKELDDRYTVDDYRRAIFDGATLVLTTRGGFSLGGGRPASTFTLGPPREEPRPTRGGGFSFGGRPSREEPRPTGGGGFSFGGRERGPTFTLGPPREELRRTFTFGPPRESEGPRGFRIGGGGEPRPRTRVEPGAFSFGGGGDSKKAVFYLE
jgi:hypothetical protein